MGIKKFFSSIGWSFHVGDPYLMGWVIFTAYIIVSLLCLFVGVSTRKLERGHEKKKTIILWLGLSVFMVLLGINKQLDLQTLFFSIGRLIARSQGWFDKRREVQGLFIKGFTFICFVSLVTGYYTFKQQLIKNIFVLIGIILLLSFIIIRAASINHVEFIPEQIHILGSNHMKYVIELGGIVLVGFGARIEYTRWEKSIINFFLVSLLLSKKHSGMEKKLV